jgi:predicted amidohydrolase
MTCGSDVERNVTTALELIERAVERGATYVQVPEYVTYYGSARGYAAAAETVPGPSTGRFAELARRAGVVVHVGSLLEASPVEGRYHNTSVLIGPRGDVLATYRKAHLFDVEVPGEVAYRESDAIVAGDEVVVADLGEFRLGLSICFDLRFPELYRRLAVAGATVLAVPSAFAEATGRVHWEVLLRARAIENHAFVVAAAQVGPSRDAPATWGHSMIVGPWGEILAESTSPGPDVIVAPVDLAEVEARRAQIAVLALRRPDLYGGG